ncbi:GCN5-related N-acetyltransferase [Serratia sp. AS12]|uniref:GNAT family N-acetyltransferase n=1 Tax=Serratia TaxID=613 RepID=UPI00020E9F9E|nr:MULTISPECIES: GNAT family N-acetyltransferase [Serratia]AEF46894.1 GCN5-related N-acetyltransferase [Serratia plymuthica AS9]AEF51846.1 GCN5-related N-acetyltransferase [Serratia sp. AS12]AEG29553.1 GCN5-related N-acetyltransferase [Serratia sp. AS13]UTN95585.1 GNAT family N-acetyltransferase [Serratia plymuthica]
MSKSPDIAVWFRRAEENDAELVREIVRAAYSKWISVIGREPTPMTADFNKAIRDHDIDLAIVEGEVVGLIEIWPQADHIWIENVAVHPHRQGIGIGRTLLAHVESKAAQAELGEIRLQTNKAFEANIALYAALGYEIDRHEPFKGGTTVFMRKNCSGY